MKFSLVTTLLVWALMGASPAVAQMVPIGQMMPMPMPNAVTTATPPLPNTPSTAAYLEAAEKMHRTMDIHYRGKPSLDFFTAVIPHHCGAMEIAQMALRYGTDQQIRPLPQKISTAHEAEIIQMKALASRLLP